MKLEVVQLYSAAGSRGIWHKEPGHQARSWGGVKLDLPRTTWQDAEYWTAIMAALPADLVVEMWDARCLGQRRVFLNFVKENPEWWPTFKPAQSLWFSGSRQLEWIAKTTRPEHGEEKRAWSRRVWSARQRARLRRILASEVPWTTYSSAIEAIAAEPHYRRKLTIYGPVLLRHMMAEPPRRPFLGWKYEARRRFWLWCLPVLDQWQEVKDWATTGIGEPARSELQTLAMERHEVSA